MGTFGSGERYGDNPFIIFKSSEYIINPQSQQDMPNPLRAMYEDLAPLLIRSPPSKRYPQLPTGRKAWDVLTDPISELIFTSAVPDPILGETLQRTLRPTVQGKEGLATHLNILVDCSGSMGDSMIYGMTATGYPMAGYHLAQVCTAMMVAQAEISKDTFAVWGFNSNGFVVWPGPSGEHKAGIDFFLDNTVQDQSCFRPSNGTSLRSGIDKMCRDLENYQFDQAVSIIIMDMAFSGSRWNRELFSDMEFNWRNLQEKGPVFLVLLGNPQNIDDIKSGAKDVRKVLSKEYKRNMDGFVVDFCVTVGEDGTVDGFAGTLCDMARVNSGDSDLGQELGIDSAETAAEANA